MSGPTTPMEALLGKTLLIDAKDTKGSPTSKLLKDKAVVALYFSGKTFTEIANRSVVEMLSLLLTFLSCFSLLASWCPPCKGKKRMSVSLFSSYVVR